MLIHILLSFILIFNLTVTPQKSAAVKPDFTGIWNAKIVRSENQPVSVLRISYTEPKLEIIRMLTTPTLGNRSSNRFVYFTDGRGERQNIPTISGEPMKSKTQRVGDKFVITSGDVSTTFEVSSNGRSLTETLTWPSGDSTRRRVHLYDRSAGDGRTDINGEWVQRNINSVISLTIEHREPEIKVTRRQVSDTQDETEISVYYTDGRGETNTQAGRAVTSVTKWKNQTLVFALSSKSKIGRDKFEFRRTIKWQVGKDGESLVEVDQLAISASPGAALPPPPRTLVYARSAK